MVAAKPNSERGMESLVTDPNGGIDVILDYGVPQVLVAHVSNSDIGTVSSVILPFARLMARSKRIQNAMTSS